MEAKTLGEGLFGPEGHPKRWLILGIMSLSLVIVMLNNVTLNVALPELSKDLNADNTELQWILDAYALVFGGALLTMGALGDKFGRRLALQGGLVLVAGAAGWTFAFADSSMDVIIARGVMGLGGALVMPSTLSIVITVFPKSERARAIAIWAAMAGIGAPIGLLVGGYVVQTFSWQAVFLVNVPVIFVALILGLIYVPESKDKENTPLDPVGSILSIAALGALLYAIIEAPAKGWDSSETLTVAAASVVLGLIFIWWENKVEYPMLPMSFFKNPGFPTGLLAITLAFFVMFSFMFTQMLHFQLVRGHTALEAAIRFFPLPLGLMPAAANSDRLVNKFGRSKVVGTGLILVAIAMTVFSTVETSTDYWVIALMFMFLGLGMGLTMAPSTDCVMEAVPDEKAGVGSATNDASREIGGALGVAIGGSVLNEFYQKNFILPQGLEFLGAGPSQSFPAAMRAGGELLAQGNPLGAQLIEIARESFMLGMVNSAKVGAVIALTASIYVFMKMPDKPKHDSEE